MRKLYETCDIRASGTRLYAFINAIRQSSIACSGQYCKGNDFFCCIRRTDLKLLQKLAADYRVDLTIRQNRSLLGVLKRYRLRMGLLAGTLLSACMIFYASNVVATIEIQGNSSVSDSVILAVLSSEGITQGTWIAGIDMTHCERRLRSVIPEIAWVGIRHTGNRLVVEVSEATPQIEMLAERTPCNIVAAVDAQITDVRVYCGQLEHLLGDGVKAGEILVSGVHTDENGHTSYRHALADITGIYTKETELTEYFTYSVTEPTGRYRICRYFCLFGIQVPLTPVQSVFTEASETESYTPFSFLSATLPCGIFQKNYTETVTSVTIRSEDETRLALNASIVRYEKNLLSDVEILDRQAIYTTEENGITCRITYTLKGEIGKVSDFYID